MKRHPPTPWLHPITRKRLRRFRQLRRAWWSLLIIGALYLTSLFSEWIANDKPVLVRFNGRTYFPILKFYPESAFTGGERQTRPDYKALAQTPAFLNHPSNYMVFPPVPFSPFESLSPERLALPDEIKIVFRPTPLVGAVDLDRELAIIRETDAAAFFPGGVVAGASLAEHWTLAPEARRALEDRWANRPAPAADFLATNREGQTAWLSLSPFTPRTAAPQRLRLTLREHLQSEKTLAIRYAPARPWPVMPLKMDAADAARIRQQAASAITQQVAALSLAIQDGDRTRRFEARFEKETVTFPFRPVPGHPLGLDSSGRDVFARLLYGLRTALSFGFILVAVAMALGTLVGAVQGYYGGRVDLFGQRTIEIWESLPFIYVLILLGSIYGQSFALLLIVYGLFNWVGISYYMRAEFLRLRKQSFVEAARVMGLPARAIISRHILPNALVPLVTFFPFSLVGAIGVMAALDYLGFGLPPPTPSWGEMLAQAQEFSRAWWLVVYPGLALFVVMLLGVFIGEGLRAAFDPRRFGHLE